MTIKYLGDNDEGKNIAKQLNKDMKRGFDVATSSLKEKWITCKCCGEKAMMVHSDTGFCLKCDREYKK